MKKRKLIREISKKTGLSKRQCLAVYDAIEDAIEGSVETFNGFKGKASDFASDMVEDSINVWDSLKDRASNFAYDVVDDVKLFTSKSRKEMSLVAVGIVSGVVVGLILAASLYVSKES